MKKKTVLPTKPSRRQTRAELIKSQIWGEHFVWWDNVSSRVLNGFRDLLNKTTREHEIQKYLELHPELIVNVVGGGHGRWVIPQKKLGTEFATDFIVGERHSFGYEWLLVELESQKQRMFNKNGDPSAALTHAIRQIQDWRGWLKQNYSYASRLKSENGLGLINIDSTTPGLILIGREEMQSVGSNTLRRQMCTDLRIRIHSYDWLLRVGPSVDILRDLQVGRNKTQKKQLDINPSKEQEHL